MLRAINFLRITLTRALSRSRVWLDWLLEVLMALLCMLVSDGALVWSFT